LLLIGLVVVVQLHHLLLSILLSRAAAVVVQVTRVLQTQLVVLVLVVQKALHTP
jgi:hypothetical protein